MIENYNVFKGIKQVFESTYTALTNSQKEGYLWFVRKDSATTVGDVYFGAKKYAEATDISIKADKSEAISALSLTMDSEYKLTLSGRTADGSGFTVSDVIDLPLETMVVSGAYDSANTQIVLTLKNGSTTSFPVSALVDGLQSEITTGNTLSADLISDGTTNKVVTGTDKTNWNNASSSAHSHDNKTVLDDISSSDVDKWDAAIQGVRVNGVDITPDTGNVIDITISEGEGGDDTDYSTQYLTFEAIEDTTFTFTRNPLQYSLDGGATWTSLSSNSHTPTVSAGNKILWKQGTTTPSITQNYGMGTFSATGSFKAYGNVMSLCYGDNFIGEVSLSGKNYILQRLFRQNTYLVDSSNLVLPATTLANQCYDSMFSGCTSLTSAPKILPATSLTYYCYQEMFEGCTSLTSAPELPAPTLKMYSYSFMFNGCTSLSYIKCLATDISASNCTYNWVQNVSSTGVFIKADGMNGWTVGNNGIPTGWVDSTESEYGYARGYQIPKKTSDLTNDSGFITSDNISGKTDSTTFGTHSATTIANGTSSQMHLPTVSASDNNKVLMVVNGVWTLVAPSMIYSGSGAPDNSQGNNGDLYIQTS